MQHNLRLKDLLQEQQDNIKQELVGAVVDFARGMFATTDNNFLSFIRRGLSPEETEQMRVRRLKTEIKELDGQIKMLTKFKTRKEQELSGLNHSIWQYKIFGPSHGK